MPAAGTRPREGHNVVNNKSRKGSGRVSFVVAVAVLVVAAVAINAAVIFGVSFKKKPVALSLPLQEIPSQLGPWKQVGVDQPLPSDIEHTLGTEKYVFRMYADTRLVKPEWIEGMNDEDQLKRDESARMIGQMRAKAPEAFVNMAVTYYTGLVDTVAHIPDRCYVADGYEPTQSPEVVTWGAGSKAIDVRYINFQDQTARGMESKNVAYFFQVNGGYEHDPITGVRLRLQDLRERLGYYAKIEMMNQVSDQSVAKRAMSEFLSASLPEIERCLPDWEKAKAADRAATAAAK
jgi:hypothetical protein